MLSDLKSLCPRRTKIKEDWTGFLAHLSRRLTRWAYSIPMVNRPSVVVVNTFKLEYHWSQWADLDQILCVALLGFRKSCIRFWDRLDQNSGFHGDKKPPLTYNGGKRCLHFFSVVFDPILFILAVTRTCIKSRTRSYFRQIGPLTL